MPYKKMGKLQRGESQPDEFAFYGFKGLNVKGAGQLLADEDMTIATNVYLRPDGAAQFRNGMATFGNQIAGSSFFILQRYYQAIKGGAAQAEVDLVLGQWINGLYKVPSSGAATFIGNLANGVTNAVPATWCQLQEPNDPFFPAGLTDVMVICTGSGGPYVYDGTNLYTPVGWAAATSAQYCAIVNGILWFGGIPAFPNQVFGTGDGIIQSFETLPAIRNFVLSTPVMGLCAQGSGATASLVIGLNGGISVLYGTGPSTFYKQDIPMSDGVTAGRTMCSDAGNIYFLGNNAIFGFDGQTVPQAISTKIEPWVLNDPFAAAPSFPLNQNRQLSWGQIYNNRYHIGYCSTSSVPNTILVYDLTVKGWTVLTTTPGIASMCLLNAPGDADPTVALVGSSTTGQAYTWDFVPAFSGGQAAVVKDGAALVLGQVQSKYFKLGVPGTNKMLLRFYPEFYVSSLPFVIPVTVSTDYGNTTTAVVVENAPLSSNVLIWDQGQWDVNLWGGTGFASFGSPLSRVDFNVQAEAFAFGVQMTSGLSPWIWSGGSGVFKQSGRT